MSTLIAGWGARVNDEATYRGLILRDEANHRSQATRRCAARSGFSLLELVIVLAVSLVLTGLLLPVLSQVRVNAQRVISSSNLRQVGLGVTMYYRDSADRLPFSSVLGFDNQPLELTAAHLGDFLGNWDSLGRLYGQGYVGNPEVFYSPSHPGQHTFERYKNDWRRDYAGAHRIYTNYHYCGHVDWDRQEYRRLEEGEQLVLATDSFRDELDVKNLTGMNVLRGDGSVRWHEDVSSFVARRRSSGTYNELWREIEKLRP